MANDTLLTVVGNLVRDPEIATTSGGMTVVNFTVASTPRSFNRETNQWEDGETLFMRCTAWRELGDNVVESLSKGTRVIVQGRLRQRSWQGQDGQKHSVIEMTVDEVGPSLRYATANVTRLSGGGNYNQGGYNQGNFNQRGGGNNGGGYSGNGGGNYGGQQQSNNFGGNNAPGYDAPRGGAADDPWSSGNSAFDDAPPF